MVHTNVSKCRSNTSRKQGFFLKQETDIIAKYRNDYPFSAALLHALSILIDRSYDQIRNRWFEEVRSRPIFLSTNFTHYYYIYRIDLIHYPILFRSTPQY